MSWLPWWHIALALIMGLLFISVVLAVAGGMFKGLAWMVTLIPQLCAWAWSKLTGRPLTSHGSARLATPAEVEAAGLYTPGRIALGTLDGRDVYAPEGSHVALIAPPRSGKSYGLVMPAIRRWAGSIIVNDLRGELYEHTHQDRAQTKPRHNSLSTSGE